MTSVERRSETYGIIWIRHGVEWSDCQWILVKHVEVSMILETQSRFRNIERREKKPTKLTLVLTMRPKIRSFSVDRSSSEPISTPASASNARPSLYSRRRLQSSVLRKRFTSRQRALTLVRDIQTVRKETVH